MKVYLSGCYNAEPEKWFGYSIAADLGAQALKKHTDIDFKLAGEEIPENWEADIEICFTHPEHYRFLYENSYKIGYTTFESTEFPPNWYEKFAMCDEIWFGTPFSKNIYMGKFPDKPVGYFMHGLSPEWKPKKRKRDESKPFTFLHVGEPYNRKDAQIVVDLFAELYGNNSDYQLILKCTDINTTTLIDLETGLHSNPSIICNNIIIYQQVFTENQMLSLFNNADCFIYPSWGEGFGLQPLQSIGMAIPTISTYAWAPYADYITLKIDSHWEISPWPIIHPGFLLKPERQKVLKAMKDVVKHYDELCEEAFENAIRVHEEYDWDKIVEPVVERLKEIKNSRI